MKRDLGIAVMKARVAKGFSQARLAKIVGLQPSTIRRLELGKFNLTILTMHRIGDALGKTLTIKFV